MRISTLLLIALCALSAQTQAKTKVHEEVSGFDGTRSLYVAPHVTGMVKLESVQLSGRWNSATPDVVAIGVTLARANVPETVSFNADGEIIELSAPLNYPNVQSSPFHGIEVGRSFVATREQMSKIVNATRLWVRVTTPHRVYDCPVRDGKEHPAHLALKMLNDRIPPPGQGAETKLTN